MGNFFERRQGIKRLTFEALFVILALIGLVSANAIGIYDGENKGVFVGNCGLEVVGDPGFFCTPSNTVAGAGLVSAAASVTSGK